MINEITFHKLEKISLSSVQQGKELHWVPQKGGDMMTEPIHSSMSHQSLVLNGEAISSSYTLVYSLQEV